MARLVRHEQKGPYFIEKTEVLAMEKDAIAICGCGLSAELPLCDGTHKTCRAAEEEGKLYLWEGETAREVQMP